MTVQHLVVILVFSQEGVRACPSTPPSWFLLLLLLHIYPKELKTEAQTFICTPLFIAALFTIAQMGSKQVSINSMDKQNVVYTYYGILFSY